MSGNPFRKKTQSSQPASPPQSASVESPAPPDEQDTARRSSKGKRVRIETPPPLSPDSPYEEDAIIRRVSNESHEGSPPPSPESVRDATLFPPALDFYDSFNQTPVNEELFPSDEVLENTRRNSETNAARRDSTGGIVNPFQRTLATIERTESSDLSDVQNPPDATDSTAKSARGHMNVDAFKRMLLTGDPGSTSHVNADQAPISGVTTTSGNSLTSDSFDTSMSATPPVQNLPLKQTPESEKRKSGPPPPPPAHRHGKRVEPPATTPHTVPFDSFTPAETITSPAPTLSTEPEAMPAALASTQMEQLKRKPPTPPSARRAGQGTPNRISLIRESPSASLPQPPPLASPPLPPPTGKPNISKAPPPPPARRQGSKIVSAPDATSYQPDETSNAPSSRSSSIASRNRVSMQAPPPPLPPPRARNSSKSSLESPADLAEAASQADEAALSSEPQGKPSNQTNNSGAAIADADILADMDRLQAEVDALRAKYSKR